MNNNGNNVSVYEVAADDRGGWSVRNARGRCLRRADTKREAVQLGAEVARNKAQGGEHFRARNSRLVVRDLNGFVSFTRDYTRTF